MHRTVAVAVAAVLAAGLAACPTAAAAGPVRSWQSYVLGPDTALVRPVRAEARGAVTHPESLVRAHGKPTTLTTTAGTTPASVLLDFGRDIAGTPSLDVVKAGGPATLTLVTGEVTKYGIDYYILLREMAWLERTIGSAAAAAGYDATADAVKTAVNSRLWSPALGAYGQSTDHPDVLVEDANALALQYDFVPADRQASVLHALRSLWTPYGAILGPGLQDPTGHTIEPFGNGMETAGRFAVNDVDGALALMRRTWGPMVEVGNPLYTAGLWEFKNSGGGVNRATASLAHGWAASPTVQLTQQVLGITPVGPGYATWTIQPRPGRLEWAQGAVPAKYGDISARWSSAAGGHCFDLHVSTPRDTSGTVAVPADEHSVLLVDGRAVRAQIADGYAGLSVRGGAHTIIVLNR